MDVEFFDSQTYEEVELSKRGVIRVYLITKKYDCRKMHIQRNITIAYRLLLFSKRNLPYGFNNKTYF